MIDEEKASQRLSGAFPFLPDRAEIYSCREPDGRHKTPKTALNPAHQVVKHRENFYIKDGKKKKKKTLANCQEALGCFLVDWAEELVAVD